jgi:hypothetical protein
VSDATQTETQAGTRTVADDDRGTAEGHRAGAFDIRSLIGFLIGSYGIVLVLMGLFGTSSDDLARAGGLNINLLAGVGMVVVAAAFLLWARWRPVVVPDDHEGTDSEA